MHSGKPLIFWCWPEAIQDEPRVLSELQRLGETTVSHELPKNSVAHSVLVPRLQHTIDAESMNLFPHLRLIATPSTGTDHIDLSEAKQRGIHVISLRHDREFLDSLQSTAELAWLLILNCMRNFRAASAAAIDGNWNPAPFRGHELIGKTLGIVGLGRLGSMVARFGLAFRMRVIFSDVRDVVIPGAERVSLDALLRDADVISLHVHLDDTTRGLIGEREFGLIKPSAVLVNTSRGAVIDEQALLVALKNHRIAAAGIDVISGERETSLDSHPLIQYARDNANLVLTPHIGGCTAEAQSKAFLHIAKKIIEELDSLPEPK